MCYRCFYFEIIVYFIYIESACNKVIDKVNYNFYKIFKINYKFLMY